MGLEKNREEIKEDEMIFNFPKKIHFTFDEKFEDLPKKSKYVQNIMKWKEMNPDFEIKYYSDEDCLEYIKKHFSHIPNLVEIYLNFPVKVMRADLFRYLVLFNEGGLYSDIDMYPNKPIKEWVKGYEKEPIDLLVALEFGQRQLGELLQLGYMYKYTPKYVQFIMLSTKRNKILERVVNNFIPMYESNKNFLQKTLFLILECGGPFYWSDTINDYIVENYDKNFGVDMVLKKENEMNLVGNVLIAPKNRFEKELNKESFAQHQFRASWIGTFKHSIQGLLGNKSISFPLRQGLLNFREELYEDAIEELKKVSIKEELFTANYLLGF